jgi:ABC-type lipoprotein export system ATPase subunit
MKSPSAFENMGPTQKQSKSTSMVTKGDTFVSVREVTRSYWSGDQPVHALRGVNLELERGALVVLKGRSGSGKTTLLNLIGGLDKPSSGAIEFEGQRLDRLTDGELTMLRRQCIGFIFQSFALLPTYSAFENVELILRITGMSGKEKNERAQRCLRAVGLTHWMDQRPDEMSGGQQQRIQLARAIATKPDLILADEPTGELDTATSRQIFNLLRQVVEKEGTTVLVATHDAIGEEYADIVYQLVDGKCVA